MFYHPAVNLWIKIYCIIPCGHCQGTDSTQHKKVEKSHRCRFPVFPLSYKNQLEYCSHERLNKKQLRKKRKWEIKAYQLHPIRQQRKPIEASLIVIVKDGIPQANFIEKVLTNANRSYILLIS